VEWITKRDKVEPIPSTNASGENVKLIAPWGVAKAELLADEEDVDVLLQACRVELALTLIAAQVSPTSSVCW